MFIVSLIANPGYPSLEVSLVDSLRNAWGGGTVHWLAPDEAAEFPVSARPDNFWDVWQSLQAMELDLVLQHADGRRKTMLLADMDSTMIQQECIDELAAEAGVGDRVAAITARAMNGELDFEDAIDERVALLAGLDESIISKVLEERITLMPGGATLTATMAKNGAYAALVSGGFTQFTEVIANRLGFDENQANQLIIENAKLTGQVARPILGQQAKVEALRAISAKQGLTVDQVMAVGDGANDLGMLGLAGTGVALHAKPSVAAQCDIRINFGDLTALLYLQGYSKDDFVNG